MTLHIVGQGERYKLEIEDRVTTIIVADSYLLVLLSNGVVQLPMEPLYLERSEEDRSDS